MSYNQSLVTRNLQRSDPNDEEAEVEIPVDHHVTLQMLPGSSNDDTPNSPETSSGSPKAECPVCLQTCIHPVQLPCNHIFCFLCIKGVANHSKKCALCRHEIPVDYLNNPLLLDSSALAEDTTKHHGGYQWYYEGRNGWWQYDQRASRELEERFTKGTKIFELLIAGFLYIIDYENMVQLRRNDPSRRRRIKRDLVTIEKKGIAGLKIVAGQEREGAYGAEGEAKTSSVAGVSTAVSGAGTQPKVALNAVSSADRSVVDARAGEDCLVHSVPDGGELIDEFDQLQLSPMLAVRSTVGAESEDDDG